MKSLYLPRWIDIHFQDKQTLAHEETIRRKMVLVEEVRELRRNGFSKREITRRTGLAYLTVSRYLDDNYTPIHAAYGKKKSGFLVSFKVDWLYTGSASNLRHHISDWKKH